MFYTIYKITNTVNGKYYIGKHQTKDLDDGYMGSGKYLKRAINKHGQDNFTKEILHVFDTEQEMNDKEAELVMISEETYNICPGGQGGFGYINENKLNIRENGWINANKNRSAWANSQWSEKISNGLKVAYKEGRRKIKTPDTTGRKHSEETKRKISLAAKNRIK